MGNQDIDFTRRLQLRNILNEHLTTEMPEVDLVTIALALTRIMTDNRLELLAVTPPNLEGRYGTDSPLYTRVQDNGQAGKPIPFEGPNGECGVTTEVLNAPFYVEVPAINARLSPRAAMNLAQSLISAVHAGCRAHLLDIPVPEVCSHE